MLVMGLRGACQVRAVTYSYNHGMEIELTPQAKSVYPVIRTNMDENQEIQQPQVAKDGFGPGSPDQEKDTPKSKNSTPEMQKKAQQAWQEYLRKKVQKGEAPSEQEMALIRKAVQRGELPISVGGGSGDGQFEHFDADKYKDTPLEDLARRLKQAGENNRVTQELRDEIQRRVNEIAGAGNEQLSNQFIGDVRKAMLEQNPSQAEQGSSQNGPETTDQLAADLEEFRKRKKERTNNPRSIQQVAETIIRDEGKDRWGRDGTFPLLDSQNRLNQANFVRWFRERMLYHHSANSRDYSLQLGNLVGIDNEFGSTISIYSMDRNRGQYFLDASSDTVLDTLANQLKNELWLFGVMRNHDLLYQEYMGSDSDLPKYLANIHTKEEMTQPGSLRTIVTMAKDFGREGDTSVGDAVRKGYEIYFYVSDFSELQKLLGANSVFFKKEGFINAFKIIEKKEKSDTSISRNAAGFIDKIFKGGVLDPAAFIEEMNPFNNQNKPELNKQVMREMVRQALAEKYGLEYGLDKSVQKKEVNGRTKPAERDFLRKDLEYAETWAWILTRWTGAAARNDTGSVGFDAMTKVMKPRDYRIRQSGEGRAGAFGNEYDLPIFKSLVSDFFNGITVEKRAEDEGKNITPFELFRALDEKEDEMNRLLSGRDEDALSQGELSQLHLLRDEKKRLFDRMNFEQSTQKAFLANHINRGFEVFHSSMGAEELRLEEIVKWDPFRGIILDRGKFEEQVKEKFLKPIRYAFSTYAQLDFGKMTRVQDGPVKPGQPPKYKEVTNAEKFFGPEVLSDLRPMADAYYKKKTGKHSLSLEEKQQGWQEFLSGEGRSLLWKRAAMARIAAHIKSHRQFGNGYAPFSQGMVNTFYQALESIRSIDLKERDEETEMMYDKRFLTEEDIQWLREKSGTTKRRLFIQDTVIKSGGYGLGKGLWEGAGLFVKDIFK